MRLDQVLKGWKRALVSLPSGLVVECEIAATEEDRERGFNGRRRPPYGSGMLFVFPQLVLSPFTMQRTEFPLDMVFMRGELNGEGAVPADITQVVNAIALDPELVWPSMLYNLCLETTSRSPILSSSRSTYALISEKR